MSRYTVRTDFLPSGLSSYREYQTEYRVIDNSTNEIVFRDSSERIAVKKAAELNRAEPQS